MAESSSSSSSELSTLLAQMQKMQEQIESLQKNFQTPKRQRTSIEIPEECRTACRTIIKTMKDENTIVFDYESYQNNIDAIATVTTEVKRLYKDKRWGDGTINEACKKIWRNLRDQNTRRTSGKFDVHKKNSKDKKRLRTKLKRRQSALSELDIPDSEKQEVAKILKMEYMSPEKSDEESEGKKRYRIPFCWESSTLANRKEQLDEAYGRKLSPSAKRQLASIYDNPDNSRIESAPPKDAPSWAISRRYKETQ